MIGSQFNRKIFICRAGVDYFTIYILSLDEQVRVNATVYAWWPCLYDRSCEYTNFVLWYYIQLSKEVQRSLENYRKQNPDTITFEIYTYFQQLVEVTKNAEDE